MCQATVFGSFNGVILAQQLTRVPSSALEGCFTHFLQHLTGNLVGAYGDNGGMFESAP